MNKECLDDIISTIKYRSGINQCKVINAYSTALTRSSWDYAHNKGARHNIIIDNLAKYAKGCALKYNNRLE